MITSLSRRFRFLPILYLFQVIRVFQASTVDLHEVYIARKNLVTAVLSTNLQTDATRKAVESLTHYVQTIGKFFRRLQQLNGSRFVTMPSAEQLVFFYWGEVVQSAQGPNLIGGS